MVITSTEKELFRKQEYYKKNKEKILQRKHERSMENYVNKINRAAESDKEFEKDFTRKLSRISNERKTICDLCGATQETLGYYLEEHHFNYDDDTDTSFLCKPCHAEADKIRRRQ